MITTQRFVDRKIYSSFCNCDYLTLQTLNIDKDPPRTQSTVIDSAYLLERKKKYDVGKKQGTKPSTILFYSLMFPNHQRRHSTVDGFAPFGFGLYLFEMKFWLKEAFNLVKPLVKPCTQSPALDVLCALFISSFTCESTSNVKET